MTIAANPIASFAIGSDTEEVVSDTLLVIADGASITTGENVTILVGETYQQCHSIVTINRDYVKGSPKFDFPFNLKKLPDGFIAGAEDNGANIRIYTSSEFIDTNRLPIDPTGGWGAETVDWIALIPFLSSTIDTDLYVVRGDPNTTLPSDGQAFGKDQVTAAITTPDDDDLTATLNYMDNVPDFSSYSDTVCVTITASGDTVLIVNDGVSATSSDSLPILSDNTVLTINDAVSALSSENITFAPVLTVADGLSSITSDIVVLSPYLTVSDCAHLHIADNVFLGQIQLLELSDISHDHMADEPWVRVPPGVWAIQGKPTTIWTIQ